MAAGDVKFTFQLITTKKFLSIEGKDSQELFLKWSMKDRIRAQMFSFDQQFQAYQKDDFALAFFKDPSVLSNLQVLSSSSKWCPLGIAAKSVTVDPVPCTQISMTFFDRLTEENLVRESGQIVKCFDEFYEDFTISDEVRKMLLLEESDNYDLYSDTEREEFLFRLFKHICLGGQVCQYEDTIEPYLDTTKAIYKDLVSVQKDADTKQLRTVSSIFKVTAADDTGDYFPSDTPHEQTFCYLIVDPFKRHVITLYHKFGASAWS